MNDPARSSRGWAAAGAAGVLATHAGLAALAVAAFLGIRFAGERLAPAASAPADPAVGGPGSLDTLLHVLVALAVIIVVARLMGVVFRALGQPAVIGEVVGGIALGPSLLGRVAPEAHALLLPPDVVPMLAVHAQLGVILYMFLVGLELDLRSVRRNVRAALAITHASMAVPFLLGAALALYLYPAAAPRDVGFTIFALFLGVAMSVTAFPVLARILADLGLDRSPLGTIALACAAAGDAVAWCLLALVVSIAQARAVDALVTIAATAAFVAIVLTIVMPVVRHVVERADRAAGLSRGGLSIVFTAMLVAAVAAQYIGIHALFGAFLFGAIIPNGSRVADELARRLEGVVAVLFLPVFFAFTGMRTELGLLDSGAEWLLCGLVVAVACAGKLGGGLLGARLSGFGWRDAAAIGALMNTRGLVELVILNIGLDLGILPPALFTMFVVMALVTTLMTTPMVEWLLRGKIDRARP